MPYFSRLTDIVTCSLTSLLAGVDDPQRALTDIIREMEQGITGAQRSMKTAGDSEARIRSEIDEQRKQCQQWVAAARQQLAVGNEDQARLNLVRKHEAESLVAGLEIQLKAATATREHLTTTFHALEARLADARRRLAALAAGDAESAIRPTTGSGQVMERSARPTDLIDVELAALKRELEGGSP
jgi:phage shock protein A